MTPAIHPAEHAPNQMTLSLLPDAELVFVAYATPSQVYTWRSISREASRS